MQNESFVFKISEFVAYSYFHLTMSSLSPAIPSESKDVFCMVCFYAYNVMLYTCCLALQGWDVRVS